MPAFNRQGPNGEGPMTGRRMGRCNPEKKGEISDDLLQRQGLDGSEQDNSSPINEKRRHRGTGRRQGFGLRSGMRFRRNG